MHPKSNEILKTEATSGLVLCRTWLINVRNAREAIQHRLDIDHQSIAHERSFTLKLRPFTQVYEYVHTMVDIIVAH